MPLLSDLQALGVRPGGVLLVHSSLRSLGQVEGGAEAVVQALLEALGVGGTLLMPALSYMSVSSLQPVFDVLRTPSCVGALTEYFRARNGTLRSLHPTHSVCGVGARAAELLSGHEQDGTPCGPNAPFSRLPLVSGQVLFLGCGLRPNTSMHAIEEHIQPPYLFSGEQDYTIIRADGSQVLMRARKHNFTGWEQRYERLEGLMTSGLRTGRVLQAECFLLEANAMWKAALGALRRDELFFVERTI